MQLLLFFRLPLPFCSLFYFLLFFSFVAMILALVGLKERAFWGFLTEMTANFVRLVFKTSARYLNKQKVDLIRLLKHIAALAGINKNRIEKQPCFETNVILPWLHIDDQSLSFNGRTFPEQAGPLTFEQEPKDPPFCSRGVLLNDNRSIKKGGNCFLQGHSHRER